MTDKPVTVMSFEEAMAKLQFFYEKMKTKERDDDLAGMDTGKTDEQHAIDVANDLLDRTALGNAKWAEIRSDLARVYADAGREDMAAFVLDPRVA